MLQKLLTDPTKLHTERVNKAIDSFKDEGLITEKVANRLKPLDPKTPKFSLLPKIHKKQAQKYKKLLRETGCFLVK